MTTVTIIAIILAFVFSVAAGLYKIIRKRRSKLLDETADTTQNIADDFILTDIITNLFDDD